MTRDSGSRAEHRDAKQARPARAAERNRPTPPSEIQMTQQTKLKACPNDAVLDELAKHLTALGLNEQVKAVMELREEYAGLCHDYDRLAQRENDRLNTRPTEPADNGLVEVLLTARRYVENVARGDGTAAESTIADADLNAIDTALSKHGEQ